MNNVVEAVNKKGGVFNKVLFVVLLVISIISVVICCLLVIFALLVARSNSLIEKNIANDSGPKAVLRRSIEHVLIDRAVLEYRARNNGQFPSGQYLEETLSPYLSFYTKITVFTDDNQRPGVSSYPALTELHIWPGYSCYVLDSSYSEEGYDIREHDYASFIKEDSSKNAYIYSAADSRRSNLALNPLAVPSEQEWEEAVNFYDCVDSADELSPNPSSEDFL